MNSYSEGLLQGHGKGEVLAISMNIAQRGQVPVACDMRVLKSAFYPDCYYILAHGSQIENFLRTTSVTKATPALIIIKTIQQ